MADLRVECPHCHKTFKLDETLAGPVIEETRRKLVKEFENKEEALEERRRALAQEQKHADRARKALDKERDALAKQKEQVAEQIAEEVEEQKVAIVREEARKAKQKYDEKLAERDEQRAELEQQIKEKDGKLAEARKQEAEFRRKQRELDDKTRELDVTTEKRATDLVSAQLEKIRKDAEEAARLPLAEKEKTIADLQARLQDAVQKASQGSQQLQGEVQELDLERRLREAFPRDAIEPVPKGQHGGDAIHRVLSVQGQVCGMILWESKRTKNWAGGWPDKLKQDQRAAKADLAVIVTQAMPPSIDSFAEVEGVWVTTPALAIPLAAALRLALAEGFAARRATDGQDSKMAILYQYMTGPEFRQRVLAIYEGFKALKDDLDSEKRAMLKRWATREKQLEIVMLATTGMYGDLQGIAGKKLPEIEGLELKFLEPGESEEPR